MMTRSEQRALNRGVLESEALNSSGADCYAAASASFDIGLGDARRDRPFLDRARAEGGQARPRWPQGAPYAVCLSHDVDSVSELDLRSHLRRFKKRGLYSLASPFDSRAMRALRSSVWSAGRSVANWRRVDPLHCYERWLELEAEVGTQSTFFFLPESYLRSHYSDGGYRYDDVIRFDGQRCSVAEMMREIHRRGWEVGLHASWHTFSSVDAIETREGAGGGRNRRSGTQRSPAQPPLRTFALRRASAETPVCTTIRRSASTMTSDFGWGPVCRGTSTIVASALMSRSWSCLSSFRDKCLTRFRAAGDTSRAISCGLEIASGVKEVGGVLTILWHPNLINDEESMFVYRDLLHRLRRDGAWFGTVSQIGGWWREMEARENDRVTG